MKNDAPKIAILGGGISGLLTAIGLSNYGIKSTVIESKSLSQLIQSDDLRTTALTERSIGVFKEFGIWDNLRLFIEEIRQIYICQNKSMSMLELVKHKHDTLGYMISNIDLRRVVSEIASVNHNINIIDSVSYTDIFSCKDRAVISLSNGQEISCDLCIISDGKHSRARQKFFPLAISKNYKQSAIIFNIEHSYQHDGTAMEHFLSRGPFAVLPLLGKSSSIVWTESHEIAKFLVGLSKDELKGMISQFIGGYLGDISIITDPKMYPLSAHVVSQYYRDRLVVLADSAHVVHPLAGQGLNLGIKDIQTLINLIYKNYANSLAIDDALLKTYHNSRKYDNLLMFELTDKINAIFSNDIGILNDVTTLGLAVVNRCNMLKKMIINYASGNLWK